MILTPGTIINKPFEVRWDIRECQPHREHSISFSPDSLLSKEQNGNNQDEREEAE